MKIFRLVTGHFYWSFWLVTTNKFMSSSVKYGALIAAKIYVYEHQTPAVIDDYIRKIILKSKDIPDKKL